MSGTEQQMEIDLGPNPEIQKTEPEIVIVENEAQLEAQSDPVENKKKEIDPAKALEKMKQKLKKEQERAEEAERQARQAMVHAHNASNEVEDTHLHLVNNAISTVKRDNEILKMNYRDALANGDYDRVAEIQESISMNSAKLLQLENGFNEMKNRPQTPPPAPPPRDITVDDLIHRVTPKSSDWLKDNREHLREPRSLRIMARAHDDAMDMGIKTETKEYFRFIENRLGIDRDQAPAVERYDDDDDDTSAMSAAAAPTQRRQAPPAAPVSRSAGFNDGSRPNRITLTAEQAEYAKISGLTPHEYWVQLQREKNRQN
jgi:hypothetical protein